MQHPQLPQGVVLTCTTKAVHLVTNAALMTYLRQPGNGSMALSRSILAIYAEEHGTALQITARSMATELLIHAYLDCLFARKLEKARLHPERRRTKTLLRLKHATEVIDMGERSVDTNRWVFDLLSPFYGLLCLLLGSRA